MEKEYKKDEEQNKTSSFLDPHDNDDDVTLFQIQILNEALNFLINVFPTLDKNDPEILQEETRRINDMFLVLTSGVQEVQSYVKEKEIIPTIINLFDFADSFLERQCYLLCIQAAIQKEETKENQNSHLLFFSLLNNFMQIEKVTYESEIDYVSSLLKTIILFVSTSYFFSVEQNYINHILDFWDIDTNLDAEICLFMNELILNKSENLEFYAPVLLTILGNISFPTGYFGSVLIFSIFQKIPNLLINEKIIFDTLFKLFNMGQHPIRAKLFHAITELPAELAAPFLTNSSIIGCIVDVINQLSTINLYAESEVSSTVELGAVKALNYSLVNFCDESLLNFFSTNGGYNLLPSIVKSIENALFEYKFELSLSFLLMIDCILKTNQQEMGTKIVNQINFVDLFSQAIFLILDFNNNDLNNRLIELITGFFHYSMIKAPDVNFADALEAKGVVDQLSVSDSIDPQKINYFMNNFFPNYVNASI